MGKDPSRPTVQKPSPMPGGLLGAAQLAALGAAVLKGPWPTSKVLKGKDLWADKSKPTLVYAVRRLG